MEKNRIQIPRKELSLILTIALILLAIVTGLLLWKDYQSADIRFQQESARLYDDLSKSLSDINAILNGMVALHNAVDIVDAEQFSLYSHEMLNVYPNINAIKLLTRVEDEFRDEFKIKMREDGFPTFAIYEGERSKPDEWKPATSRSLYYPITAIEPLEPGKIISMGYDMYSVPEFRKTIDYSIRTGESASAKCIALMKGINSYVVFKPIYAGRVLPLNESERKSQNLYMVAVVIRSADLLPNHSASSDLKIAIHNRNPLTGTYEQLINTVSADNRIESPSSFIDFSFNRPVIKGGQSLMLSISRAVGPEIINIRMLVTIFVVWSAFLSLILYIVNTHHETLKERQESLHAWQWEKERADVTLHSLADAVITTNQEAVVEYMNPVAERLTGWKIDEAKGRGVEDIFRLINEADEKSLPCPVLECIRRGVMKQSDQDISLAHRNGEHLSIDYSIAPMYGQSNNVLGAVLVFQDVGSSRMLSKLLSYQAAHDDLTGLYNRREFERRLSRSIERVFKFNEHYILFYMDLDQFKVVNDTCGHMGGDLVLRQIAELVSSLIRERETFARLGGDEFGVLLEGYTLDEALVVANEILEAIRKYRFHWSGKIFEIGVSIGIVDIDSGMQSISNIMGYADAACYMAKELSGNNIQVYQIDDADYKQRKDQMKWVQRITQAFADSRFILYAQKIVSLHGDSNEHFEILMRMLDDNGEIIVPQEYIIAAERYGSMQDIDRWVIRNAFILINNYVSAARFDNSLPVRNFAINLSGQSLSSNSALEYVKQQLQEYPDIVGHIVFEITETAAISNLVSAQRFIAAFRDMGVKFSLDDFGTGVSSFNYLKNLNVDYLKIDGGFVREMMVDPVDYAMVKSIAHIGHVMGVKTIAEHTETLEICENLRDMGVDYAQGFCLHEPERLDQLV
jgi:diguanylate cyclase (GGDEF)-like protein/PAS domain S-box-containing protein